MSLNIFENCYLVVNFKLNMCKFNLVVIEFITINISY